MSDNDVFSLFSRGILINWFSPDDEILSCKKQPKNLFLLRSLNVSNLLKCLLFLTDNISTIVAEFNHN